MGVANYIPRALSSGQSLPKTISPHSDGEVRHDIAISFYLDCETTLSVPRTCGDNPTMPCEPPPQGLPALPGSTVPAVASYQGHIISCGAQRPPRRSFTPCRKAGRVWAGASRLHRPAARGCREFRHAGSWRHVERRNRGIYLPARFELVRADVVFFRGRKVSMAEQRSGAKSGGGRFG